MSQVQWSDLPSLPKDQLLSFGHTNQAMQDYGKACWQKGREHGRGDTVMAPCAAMFKQPTPEQETHMRMALESIFRPSALEEALAHLRTLANFGGTIEQARELAQRGIDRVEGMR